MEAAKKAASDREEMNRILQLQNQELQQKLVRYDALKESEEQAQKEAAALQLKIRELQQTLEHETGQKKNLEQIATQAQQPGPRNGKPETGGPDAACRSEAAAFR